MLASKTDPEANQNFIRVMKEIYKNEGVGKLFSGVYPRTFWITIGGFIYLGWLIKYGNSTVLLFIYWVSVFYFNRERFPGNYKKSFTA